jgi:hypothetical protein
MICLGGVGKKLKAIESDCLMSLLYMQGWLAGMNLTAL